MSDQALKVWLCLGCGFSYDEAQGLQQPLRAQDDVHLICALSGG